MAEKKEIKVVADLTEKCQAALNYLRANDNGEEGYLGAELAAATGINPQGIHGVMTSLVKYGFVAKGSKEAPFTSKDGKSSGVKPYTTYFITDAGRDLPEA